jgi:Flp pilus assembly protein TadD
LSPAPSEVDASRPDRRLTPIEDRLAAALAGRYRIERELGAGGMATVWLAHDLKHDRKVAIKVLHPHLAALLGADRFLKEIKTTANLQHPHILALHDSGDADGLLFYVMPFVDGESLRQRIAREKQLPVADAVRISSEVAGALDYAHRQGVIHRDIKPENILLHEGSALVADFGIALAPASGEHRLTETGLSLGTPHYMSPEQALGERQLDARSDIYAVGAVLYEMLTGAPPFTGPSAQAIVAKVISQQPVPPSRIRKDIPAQIEATALTALQKEPGDRFPTAAAFQAALGGNVAVGRIRRRGLGPRAIAGIGLTVALILIALAVRPWQATPRAHPRHVPDTAAVRLVTLAAAIAQHRDPEHCDQAIAKFSQAADKDSMYVAALGGLAEANALCALVGGGDPAVRYTAARAAAERALRLDSTGWAAHTAAGMVHLFHEQNWADAEREFALATRYDSTRFSPWQFRTWYYMAVNDVDSAELAIRHARALEPVAAPVLSVRLATVLRIKGDFAAAARELDEVLQQDSTRADARSEQLELDVANKDCARAARDLLRMKTARSADGPFFVAYSWAICGKPESARRYADSVARQDATGAYVNTFYLAVVYAGLGDSTNMLKFLDEAVAKHHPHLFFLRHQYAFKAYRAMPQFVDIMKRANVK